MVAIVAGSGMGLFNASTHTLGPIGMTGRPALGQVRGLVYVNAATGNLVLQALDEYVSGRGLSLPHLRTHNSLGAATDGDGDGWHWNGEAKVALQGNPHAPGSTITRTTGDGHETTYTLDGTRYTNPEGPGAHDTIALDSGPQLWVWTEPTTRLVEKYAVANGRLVARQDLSGNVVNFHYDSQGRLIAIADSASGQRVNLVYAPVPGPMNLVRLHRVETVAQTVDATGRPTGTLGTPVKQVEYGYDDAGRLRTVKASLAPTEPTNTAVHTTTYTYDDTSNRVASVEHTDSTSATFTYDSASRIYTVVDADGTQAFDYATITDPDGKPGLRTDVRVGDRVWSYHTDNARRLTKIESPAVDGARPTTQFRYDGAGNVLSTTDANGNVVTCEYDARGNKMRERDAFGNTVVRTYDTRNQVVTETRYLVPDPDGTGTKQPAGPLTTRYVYDSQARQRFVVSAEGRVTEQRYGAMGKVSQLLRYTGGRYDVRTTPPSTVLNEGQLIDWVATQDKRRVQLTQYSYDLRGQLSQRTDFATVDANGAGILDAAANVTELFYDGHGDLLRTVAVRGTTREERTTLRRSTMDGLGRELRSESERGPVTTAYADADRSVRVTEAAGLVETRDYDAHRRLASIGQTGSGATRASRRRYDNAGRLRMTEDAQGGWTFSFYDDSDRLRFVVDRTGAVIGYTHTGTGQIATETRYHDAVDTSSWYDSATKTVVKQTLTIGTDLIADAEKDRTTRTEYDTANRVESATDAEGTATTTTYDGLSRTTVQEVGDRVTRFFYDRDGRQVGVLDPERFLTENKYDATGQLVETVRYSERSDPPSSAAGSIPPFDWRPEDKDALHTFVYYDGQGRVVGTVDERGFLTETAHDAAANTQREIRYEKPVVVTADDTLATLRTKAGAPMRTDVVEYDGFGRVSRRVATDGTQARNEHDNAGRLVREVSATGTTEQRGNRTRRNAFGEMTGSLDGVGDATLPANPTAAQIDQAIEDHGNGYDYDSLGRQARLTNARGKVTLFFYDRENRPTHTINAEREVTETSYNRYGQRESVRRYATWIATLDGLTGGPVSQLAGKLPAVDAAEDQLVRYEYDRRGLLVKETDGEGFVITRTYTLHRQLATETRTIKPGTTVTTRYDYDLNGDLIGQTHDLGGANAKSQTEYDSSSRVIAAEDALGKTTATTYPDGGRVVVTTDELDRTTRLEHDAAGRVLKRVDATDQPTTYVYDDVARSVVETSPEGVKVTTRQTRHGQTLSMTDARGGVTTYEYNERGQLTKVIDPLDVVTRHNEYDNGGRLLKTTDGRGTVVSFGYDDADRLEERRVDGTDVTTAYEFNALGQQVRVTEGAGTSAARVTTYKYDRRGQLRQVIVDPDGLALSTRYSIDGVGNTVLIEQGTVAAPSQHVVQHVFDKLGRKTKEIAAPSSIVGPGTPDSRDLTTESRYDLAGRLTRKLDANGESTWSVYDAAGQLVQVVNAEGEVVESTHDDNGRLLETRRYLNRLSAAKLDDLGNTPGRVTVAKHPNDQRTRMIYDKDGRVRFTLAAAQDTNWAIIENRYDAKGNVVETRRYDTYAAEDRLDPITTVAGIAEELDALGYKETDESLRFVQRTRFAYDANDKLRFTVDARGAVSETVYDGAGNVVRAVRYAAKPILSGYSESTIDAAVDRTDDANEITQLVYDVAGRSRFTLRVQASDAQGKATEHLVTEQVYDALGQVRQTIAYATPLGPVADYKVTTVAAAVKTSADDRREAVVYDAAGRQVYRARVLAPGSTGKHAITKNEFDALGRVVRTTAYEKLVGLADFERATVDQATARNTSPLDRTTSFVYDITGRQRYVVAADGSFGEVVYDALGQVRERRQFDIAVTSTTQRTEAALTAHRGSRSVGDGVTRGEKYTYDKVGRVRTVTDAEGYVETHEYNGLGDRTGHIDKNGGAWTYTFDRQARMFRKISPKVSVALDPAQPGVELTSLEDRTYHDAFGNLTKKVERIRTPGVRTTDFVYDTLGRLIKTELPGYYLQDAGRFDGGRSADGRFRREIQLAYDAFGRVFRTATRTSATTFQFEFKSYDRLGRQRHDVDESNRVVAFEYTPFGEQSEVTRHSVEIAGNPANPAHWTVAAIAAQLGNDAEARTITTAYDTFGRKRTVAHPFAAYCHGDTKLRANAAGVDVAIAAAQTRYEHNAFGEVRLEAVKRDDTTWLNSWHYYDLMGREKRTVDSLNHHTSREYDRHGNLDRIVEFASPGAAGTSDEVTLPTVSANVKDRITKFGYDALDRQTSVRRFGLRYTSWNGTAYVDVVNDRDTDVTVQSLTYDGLGNVRTQTDALGGVTAFEYNALSHVTKVTEPARATAGAGVDPFVNPRTAAPFTVITPDGFGNARRRERHPGGGAGQVVTAVQSFDHVGNLLDSTDARGNKREYRYDFASRVTTEMQANQVTLGDWRPNDHTIERRFAYDENGRQTATLDVFVEGLVTKQSGVRTLYNAFGQIREERKVWGEASAPLDSLASALVASYSYDEAGNLTSKVAADGATHYFYDFAGGVTRQEQIGRGATAGTGPRITETGYDDLGRALIQRLPAHAAITPFGLHNVTPTVSSMEYDRWGNVTSRTSGLYVDNDNGSFGHEKATHVTYEYNADNQPSAEQPNVFVAHKANGRAEWTAASHELRYDLLGRVVQEVDKAGPMNLLPPQLPVVRTRSKQYNAAGQVTVETDATGISTRHAYDAHGNQVGDLNAVGTVFVDTHDGNGNVLTHAVLRTGLDDPYVHGSSLTPAPRLLNRYLYDQANRRVGSADCLGAGPSFHHWSYTLLDERGYARSQRNASNVVTTCDFDVLGNKVLENDANNNARRWAYTFEDYIVGRLINSTVGTNRTTGYEYNEFGQVKSEVPPDPRSTRTIEYHANGLLKQVRQVVSRGNKGSNLGGYWHSEATSQYDYDGSGELSEERFVKTGEYDILHRTGEGEIEPETIQMDRIDRVVQTRFDHRGNLANVTAPGDRNPGLGYVFVDYRCDELGNIRNLRGFHTPEGQQNPDHTDLWYTYDGEGRMTIVDGFVIQDKEIVPGWRGTKITYDGLGRRRTAQTFLGPDSEEDPEEGEAFITGWTNYREEQYDYNDLSHLEKVWQRVNQLDRSISRKGKQQPLAPWFGHWEASETRECDVRGSVLESGQYTQVSSTEMQSHTSSSLMTTSRSTYRRDGQLETHKTTNTQGEPEKNTEVDKSGNHYDAAGVLRSYTYRQGKLTDDEFTNTYVYSYTTELGGYREGHIGVTSTEPKTQPGSTSNKYDWDNHLLSQTVDIPGGTLTRTFAHDVNDKMLSKEERRQTSGSGSVVGRQDYTYADGRLVATIGSGSFHGTQYSFNFTPISAAYPSTSPSTHVVRAGDTLASIAQSVFGDPALWHVIADANNVSRTPAEALPITELGKSYRVPNVVGSIYNSAGTFRPQSTADLIGDNTPSPRYPPPPSPDLLGTVLATVAIAAVVTVVTVYTGGLAGAALGKFMADGLLVAALAGAAGGMAGSIAGQAVAYGLNQQDSFSGRQVLAAGLTGAAGGVVKKAKLFTSPLAKALQGFSQNTLAHAFVGLPLPTTGTAAWNLGTNLALAGALGGSLEKLDEMGRLKWGCELQKLASAAVNPQRGWAWHSEARSWSSIANQAAGAFTDVVVGAFAEWSLAEMLRARKEAKPPKPAPKRAPKVGQVVGGFVPTFLQDSATTTTTVSDEVGTADMEFEALYGRKISRTVFMDGRKMPGSYVTREYDKSPNMPAYIWEGGVDYGEIIEIIDVRSEVERARLAAPGNTSIQSKQEHDRIKDWEEFERPLLDKPMWLRPTLRRMQKRTGPERDALRDVQYRVYRVFKDAEYQRNWRLMEGHFKLGVGIGWGVVIVVGGSATVHGAVTAPVGTAVGLGADVVVPRAVKAAGINEWWGTAISFGVGVLASRKFDLPEPTVGGTLNAARQARADAMDVARLADDFTAAARARHGFREASGTIDSVKVMPDQPVLGVGEPTVFVQLEQGTFSTMDEAAEHALRLSNPYSVRTNTELGGLVYRTPGGRYAYTGPIEGGTASVSPLDAPVPRGAGTPHGDYHTHGDYSALKEVDVIQGDRFVRKFDVVRVTPAENPQADFFSPEDVVEMWRNSYRFNNPSHQSYLATPSGRGFAMQPDPTSNFRSRPFGTFPVR